MTDAESSGLLDGLVPAARAERAELLDWLLEQGFTVEEIRASLSPMLLPARRVLGDDGSQVSARQISEQTGLELEQLTRFQRAAGLPHVEDPDAPLFVQSDGNTAVHIKRFLDLGLDPDLMLAVVRVLAQGLANASDVMNVAALAAVLHPGASELDTARGTPLLPPAPTARSDDRRSAAATATADAGDRGGQSR
jgi:adenylate cyclase